MDTLDFQFQIAPCGMNCSVCMAFLRTKNKCKGCRCLDLDKAKTRIHCKIKNCEYLNSEFCFTCIEFPCKRLMHLDKRYRTKYNMSMVENLENIKKTGLIEFVVSEKERWKCKKCGGTICIHKSSCTNCGETISGNKLPEELNN